ncbi:MAG: hypothetical protein GY906_30385 [bacterium]|nr:hypothetical protein [bacterium]
MNTSDERESRLFASLAPPKPPSDLRNRTLTAMQDSIESGRDESHSDIWERIWSNTRLRWAWATTIGLLIAAHLAIPISGNGVGPAQSPTGRTMSEAMVVVLKEIGEMPALRGNPAIGAVPNTTEALHLVITDPVIRFLD